MNLNQYLRALRSRWLDAAIVALATLGLTAAGTFLTTQEYTSSARIFFAVQGGESVSDLAQGSNYTEKQMTSYTEVARSPMVLQPVAEGLEPAAGVNSLAEAVEITVAADTTILVISATDADPNRARDIADAVAAELPVAVDRLNPERSDGVEAVRATMLSEAQTPTSPSSPNVLRNLALGGVLGILLGVGFAILREVFDTRVRDAGDLDAISDTSTLATIPMDSAATTRPFFLHHSPMSARAEAMRMLRTNLQFVNLTSDRKSILLTSSISGEGKTTMALNLAASLADTGSRVILVDADTRQPSVAKYLGFEGSVGLTTVLIGKASITDVVQPWQNSSLDILASGQVPPNPSELLGSPAMSNLLNELETQYDVVIIDGPPVLPVADAIILSKMTGGTLLVAGADRIHKTQLAGSLEALEQVDARLLGIVLNKADAKGSSNYYGEYRTTDDPALTGSRAAIKSRGMAHARRSTRPKKNSPAPSRR